MTIDWSKAPNWATGQGKVDDDGLTVWVGEECYSYTTKPDDTFYWASSKANLAYRHRSELRCLIERPASWNGEGLPPVGAIVERAFSHSTWKLTTICGHSTDGAYAAFYDGDGLMGWADKCKLRPIRTAEQIAEDQKKQEVQELMIILGSVESAAYKDIATAIQQANFRKQVSQ
ncbi:hypothetical protein RYA60_18550 [Pseudomonas syringae]|nr:hypothetical protein [Pseudomonas syringae]